MHAAHAYPPRAHPPSGAPQVIISAVLGRRSFLGGTARMEARSRHNGQKGPEWATLPESKQHTQQIREVFHKKRHWKELLLPWVSGGLVALAVNSLPIGFDETIVFAPLALFGRAKEHRTLTLNLTLTRTLSLTLTLTRSSTSSTTRSPSCTSCGRSRARPTATRACGCTRAPPSR